MSTEDEEQMARVLGLFEEDEPVEDILGIFTKNRKGLTTPPRNQILARLEPKLPTTLENRRKGMAEGVAAAARRQAGLDIAQKIRAELVCCFIYDEWQTLEIRRKTKLTQAELKLLDSQMTTLSARRRGHEICYWGEAAAKIAENMVNQERRVEQLDD